MNPPPPSFLNACLKARIPRESVDSYWKSLNQEIIEELLLWICNQQFFDEQLQQKLKITLKGIVDTQKTETHILDHLKPLLDEDSYKHAEDQYASLFVFHLRSLYDKLDRQANLLSSK